MVQSVSAQASATPAAAAGKRRGSRRNVNTRCWSPFGVVLFLWMIVPLGMTLWFSFLRYNLLVPTITGSPGSRTTATWSPTRLSGRR